MLAALRRIEAAQIADAEIKSLGHRIVFDQRTGWSTNIFGCHCDPKLLDKNGYQERRGD